MHYACIDNPRKLCPICPLTEEIDADVDDSDVNVDEDVNMDEDVGIGIDSTKIELIENRIESI